MTMSIGLLLITHNHIGAELARTASVVMGLRPMPMEVLSITAESVPEDMLREARQLLTRLDQGAGVLVLTDMFGSTPSNIATQLLEYENVLVIAGINLPMLVRVLNYPQLTLNELAAKALSGGRDGILLSRPLGD